MTTPVRCCVCGRFIGPLEPWTAEVEPLSEFGPERIEHYHQSCFASCDTHPKGGDAQQAPALLSGAVPERQTPNLSKDLSHDQ